MISFSSDKFSSSKYSLKESHSLPNSSPQNQLACKKKILREIIFAQEIKENCQNFVGTFCFGSCYTRHARPPESRNSKTGEDLKPFERAQSVLLSSSLRLLEYLKVLNKFILAPAKDNI